MVNISFFMKAVMSADVRDGQRTTPTPRTHSANEFAADAITLRFDASGDHLLAGGPPEDMAHTTYLSIDVLAGTSQSNHLSLKRFEHARTDSAAGVEPDSFRSTPMA